MKLGQFMIKHLVYIYIKSWPDNYFQIPWFRTMELLSLLDVWLNVKEWFVELILTHRSRLGPCERHWGCKAVNGKREIRQVTNTQLPECDVFGVHQRASPELELEVVVSHIVWTSETEVGLSARVVMCSWHSVICPALRALTCSQETNIWWGFS